ncbi:MAG: HAD family hydrolase, partial [candidate division FCPU426 bacterium]
IVFDLDGTLHDQEAGERASLENLFRRDIHLDPTPGFAEFLRVWRHAADAFLDRFHGGQMTFEEQRSRRVMALHENFGKTISLEEARALNDKYVAYYEEEWRPFEDTHPALSALKRNFRLGMITNGDGKRQRGKLKSCALDQYFESVIISGEVGSAKPERGIFDLSRKAFGLDASEMAYVGDRVEIDVLGARNAGWRGLWLDRKGMPGNSDPDTIQSLLELETRLI